MKIRDEVAKVTGFYFTDKTKISDSLVQISREGRFDVKQIAKVVGSICDYLEEKESK